MGGWYAYHSIEGKEPEIVHREGRMQPGQADGPFETRTGAINHVLSLYEAERSKLSISIARVRRMKRRSDQTSNRGA